MNLEVTAVSEQAPAKSDVKDWIVMTLLGAGFVASWTYVFAHPGTEAFGICMGGQGTFIAAFHWISMKDDKSPDRKDG